MSDTFSPSPPNFSPVPLLMPGQAADHAWCQRCIRAFKREHRESVEAVLDQGCNKGLGTKCDRCIHGRRPCVAVPGSLAGRANQILTLAARCLEDGIDDATQARRVEEVCGLASELDKAMLAAGRRATAGLSGVAPLPSPGRRPAAAAAGAAGDGLTEATGRLLVHAVRTLAQVAAQANNIALPLWPEDVDRAPPRGTQPLAAPVTPRRSTRVAAAAAAALPPPPPPPPPPHAGDNDDNDDGDFEGFNDDGDVMGE